MKVKKVFHLQNVLMSLFFDDKTFVFWNSRLNAYLYNYLNDADVTFLYAQEIFIPYLGNNFS